MLKDYAPAENRTLVTYELAFDDGRNNGFGFPCDENGELLDGLAPEAVANYHYCLKHPELFDRFNKVIRHERRVKNSAHGTCSCGEEIELWDQYMGACQCPKCNQWYNLFGQELLPPENWEEC